MSAKKPTGEQLSIISCNSQVILIVAVAGSGKTTTLAMLAKHRHARGVESVHMLGLVFSRSAVKRLTAKAREESAPRFPILLFEDYAAGLMGKLVKADLLAAPKSIITDEGLRIFVVEAARIVWQRYEDRGKAPDFEFGYAQSNYKVDQLLKVMRKLKGTLTLHRCHDEEFDLAENIESLADEFETEKEVIEICFEYERHRRPEAGMFRWQAPEDYVPDLLELLILFPRARDFFPRMSQVFVDEWHDINRAEFQLLRRLLDDARLVAVGDPDQVINLARGADRTFMEEQFNDSFRGAARLPLSVTQRCGSSVSRMAHQTTGATYSSASGLHTEVCRGYYDPSVEGACAEAVVKKVEMIRDARADTRLKDIAIIVRSADQSIDIENKLLDADIPHNLEAIGGSYLDRPEILMLRALLHLITDNYDTLRAENSDVLNSEWYRHTNERIVETLFAYFNVALDPGRWEMEVQLSDDEKNTDTPLRRAQKAIAQEPSTLKFFFSGVLCNPLVFDSDATKRWKIRLAQVVSDLGEMKNCNSAADLLTYASDKLDIPAATSRAFVCRERADSALRSIKAFIAFAGQNRSSAADFLREVRQRQRKVHGKKNYLTNQAQVTVTTVETAKGLEWPFVIIPYLEEGHFPRTRKVGLEKSYFYIAITRVIDELTLIMPDHEHAFLRSSLLYGVRR